MENSKVWIDQFFDCEDDMRDKSKEIVDEISKSLKEENVVVSSRIKGRNSLKEKIVRNKYNQKYKSDENIFAFLKDGIGVRIICLEQRDEVDVYRKLLDMHNNGTFSKFSFIEDSIKEQPEYQKNGHAIYRINAKVDNYIFEIQIKSTTHMLWGEIEHLLFYKNYDCYIGSIFLQQQIEQIYGDLIAINLRLSNLREHMKVGSINRTNHELIEIATKMLQENVQEELFTFYEGVKLDFRNLYTAIIKEYFYSKQKATVKKKKKLETIEKIKYDDFAEALNVITKLSVEGCNALTTAINHGDIAKKSVHIIVTGIEKKLKEDINKDEWILFINITANLLNIDVDDVVINLANRLSKKFMISIDNELEIDMTEIEQIIFEAIVNYFVKYGNFMMLDDGFIDAVSEYIGEVFEIIFKSESEILAFKIEKRKVIFYELITVLIDFGYSKELSKEKYIILLDSLGLKEISVSLPEISDFNKAEFISVLKRGII